MNLCPCGKTLMVKIKKRLKNRHNSGKKQPPNNFATISSIFKNLLTSLFHVRCPLISDDVFVLLNP